jgi:hypothetical protein
MSDFGFPFIILYCFLHPCEEVDVQLRTGEQTELIFAAILGQLKISFFPHKCEI